MTGIYNDKTQGKNRRQEEEEEPALPPRISNRTRKEIANEGKYNSWDGTIYNISKYIYWRLVESADDDRVIPREV